jgi:DNA-binding helix-turn-helix protein
MELNERILEIKQELKIRKISYEKLSQMSEIPLNTLKNIFSGKTLNPRIDTVQSIEIALGLENEKKSIMERPTSEIMELIEHDDYFKQFANLYKLMTEVQKGIFLSYVITTLKKAGVNTVPYIGY